jgi:ubiquinone/menaquinone biosynthesis C-methylase UbiE
MADRGGDVTQGFRQVDQAHDPRFFIEFLDARKTIEGEREVKEHILEMLDLKPGAQVLDVGSGTGDDAREIAGLVAASGQIVGIDASDALIAESRKRAAGSGLPVDFRLGDVRNLEFPDATFDRIRTDRVQMFVPEIETALAEMVRVLRTGGRVVASELDHELRFIDSPPTRNQPQDPFGLGCQQSAALPRPPTGAAFRCPWVKRRKIYPADTQASIPVPGARQSRLSKRGSCSQRISSG